MYISFKSLALELGVLVVVVVLVAVVLISASVMLETVSLQCMRKTTETWPAANAQGTKHCSLCHTLFSEFE